MVIAIVLVLLVVGSILFSFLSPWWFTPLASNWGTIDDTLIITFVICGVVFAALVLFMALALIRYRHRDGHKAIFDPENKKLEWWLTGVTSVGIAAMLAPGLIAWGDFITVPEDASTVEVVGEQWSWTFRFPGEDGQLGRVDPANANYENPFGIDPNDPAGQDDILVEDTELHLPLDEPVKVLLRSKDVLHDFYVSQFRAKMDLVPGTVSYFWLTPTREGRFEILCAELCGTGHSLMRGGVTVEARTRFDEWLSEYPTYKEYVEEARAKQQQKQKTAAISGDEIGLGEAQ